MANSGASGTNVEKFTIGACLYKRGRVKSPDFDQGKKRSFLWKKLHCQQNLLTYNVTGLLLMPVRKF
jgi:hypothetical protein